VGLHPGEATHLPDGVEGFLGDIFFYHLLIIAPQEGRLWGGTLPRP
jgi:hypothetical protein